MGARSRDLASEIQRLEKEWTEMLQNVKPPEIDEIYMQSIYRVPPNIRENNPKAYTPQYVSIGPYHKVHGVGKEDNILQSMETLKLKYLKGFLDRTNMRDLVVEMKELEESKIQSYYAETIECNDNFLKMILIDACFIIELFLKWKGGNPLMIKRWMLDYIDLDLLLLENQLPFCILEKLHKLTRMNEKFLDITFHYFGSTLFGDVRPGESPKHFTDLLRSSIISSSKIDLERPEECKEVKHVYSASQLMDAGLEFEVNPNKSFLDLTYSKHGVLSMPILNIHDSTELLLRNIMAYEHCHHPATTIITQYAAILDFLINTEKDVNILVDKKIIVNWMGDANAVVAMINNLNSNVAMPDFNSHYFSICNSLNEFYENPVNKYKAMFVHDYFNSPWKKASTISAMVLLLLTFIQTICSIISLF